VTSKINAAFALITSARRVLDELEADMSDTNYNQCMIQANIQSLELYVSTLWMVTGPSQ
jgi:hypothetical protein